MRNHSHTTSTKANSLCRFEVIVTVIRQPARCHSDNVYQDYDRWLAPEVPGAEELLRPCPSEWLEAVPVSTRVNSPANDDESILEPEGEPLAAQRTLL